MGWMSVLFFWGVGEEGGCLASSVGTIVGGCGWETAYRGGNLVPIGEKLLVWRIERWMMLQRRKEMAMGFATYTGRGRRRTLGVT